jgi:hypothetical protein
MEQMPADEAWLQQHSHSLGSRPIRVLSTGYHGVHTLDPTRKLTAEQQQYQDGVARAGNVARAVLEREAAVHRQKLRIPSL